MRRLAGYVWSAVDASAEAILVTCSSIGPAVDAVTSICPVPLVRIDLGMVETALDTGTRIGVLAALSTTLGPTSALVERRAGARGATIELISHVCEGAFEMLSGGDRPGHNAAIVDAVKSLAARVDVIILAQASMAGALDGELRRDLPVPVLSSPELGILELKRQIG